MIWKDWFIIILIIIIIVIWMIYVTCKITPNFVKKCAFPEILLTEKTPLGADYEYLLKTEPNKKVIYWTAMPMNPNQFEPKDPFSAYGDFSNSGIVKSDEYGIARLKFKKPQPLTYNNIVFPSHIHYRIASDKYMLSSVQTIIL